MAELKAALRDQVCCFGSMRAGRSRHPKAASARPEDAPGRFARSSASFRPGRAVRRRQAAPREDREAVREPEVGPNKQKEDKPMSVLEAEAPVQAATLTTSSNADWLSPETYRQSTAVVAHPCDQVSLESRGRGRALKLIDPILVGPGKAHPRRLRKPNMVSTSAPSRLSMRAQPGFRSQGGRARPRRPRRGADEGQPPHRRADGRGRQARHRPQDIAAHQSLLRHGRARP